MKSILVLTDFSPNAVHAAYAGAMLAKHMHTNILLFNANTTQPVAPVYAGGPTVIEDFNFMEEENNAKLRKLADSLRPFAEDIEGPWKPSIHFEEGLGVLAYQVKSLIDAKNIEMVVMGARQGSRIDHFLTGSETFSVIDHVSRPVLVIPYDTELKNLKKVIFATNFSEADIRAVKYLVKLGHIFNYRLEVVHINTLGDDDITKELRKSEFMNHIHKLRYPIIGVTEIHGKDIVERLNRLCEESGTGLLAFTHYHDSFLSRIFHQSTTRKALEHQKVPMLILPSKF